MQNIDYLQYIKTFNWMVYKYAMSHSLAELVGIIAKNVRSTEDFLKSRQEELNGIKNQLANYTKKDGGNYTVKDFTDEIYQKCSQGKEVFVEYANSTMF